MEVSFWRIASTLAIESSSQVSGVRMHTDVCFPHLLNPSSRQDGRSIVTLVVSGSCAE